MCGIAGVVAWDDRYRVDRETLRRMSARIAHRGPDGDGLYLNHEAQVRPGRPQAGFVHRRLAIIDPDPRANQPFTDGRARWITYNGEIYNYRELRSELRSLRPDYEWRTDCDTEVLLVAYDVWGEKCVEKLNGMFAFAVWDEAKKELFLARDRMGQKPLYVARRTGMVAFASELPAIRALPRMDARVIDDDALVQYLRYGYVGGSRTLCVGVSKLQYGMRLRVAADASVEEPYYEPSEDRRPVLGDADAAASTRLLLSRAVERQLVSDVPLGVFLSGGVDSSIIAACARRVGPVETFCIGFEDPRYDESRFAQRVACHLDTRHHRFVVRPDAAEDLPKLAAVFGEPFADSSALPTHYLARETRRHVKVALSGDGGDELFGGYERYRAMAIAASFRNFPAPFRMLMTARLWQRLPGVHPKSRLARLKRLLASLKQRPGERYEGYMSLFDTALIGQLLNPDRQDKNHFRPVAHHLDACLRDCDDVRSALATDRATYLPDDLLTTVDRASMLHALEVRSPFMDHELVQFAAGLTADQLLKGGPKRMLREAFADDLPAWVFKRKKMGFAVPIGDWFRAGLRPMLHDHLFAAGSFAGEHFNMPVVRRMADEHQSMKQDHSQRLYALLMLELWQRQRNAT
jgi:asparagine synthase (glutamine-hydrolysing)